MSAQTHKETLLNFCGTIEHKGKNVYLGHRALGAAQYTKQEETHKLNSEHFEWYSAIGPCCKVHPINGAVQFGGLRQKKKEKH